MRVKEGLGFYNTIQNWECGWKVGGGAQYERRFRTDAQEDCAGTLTPTATLALLTTPKPRTPSTGSPVVPRPSGLVPSGFAGIEPSMYLFRSENLGFGEVRCLRVQEEPGFAAD